MNEFCFISKKSLSCIRLFFILAYAFFNEKRTVI
jgi:hypothetical protein